MEGETGVQQLHGSLGLLCGYKKPSFNNYCLQRASLQADLLLACHKNSRTHLRWYRNNRLCTRNQRKTILVTDDYRFTLKTYSWNSAIQRNSGARIFLSDFWEKDYYCRWDFLVYLGILFNNTTSNPEFGKRSVTHVKYRKDILYPLRFTWMLLFWISFL